MNTNTNADRLQRKARRHHQLS